jgi:hypothetical protein
LSSILVIFLSNPLGQLWWYLFCFSVILGWHSVRFEFLANCCFVLVGKEKR